MYTFFKKRPVQPVVVVAAPHPPEYYILRRKYVHLCINNTHYSAKKAGLDFEALMLDTRIADVAVNSTERMLLIGTHEVFIPFESETYHIGSFIIKLTTETREWMKDYRTHLHFERVTGHATDGATKHLHPHINELGGICMKQDMLTEAASSGDLATATRIALSALWTFDAYPYKPIKEWPVVAGGRHA